jgi:hypothetical protein
MDEWARSMTTVGQPKTAPLTFGRRLKFLLASGDSFNIRRVFWANAIAAVGLGGATWVLVDMPLAWGIVTVVGTFLTLTGCLLYRHTLWIPACLGGLVMAAGPSVVLAGFAERVHPLGRWIGGGVGFALGFGTAVWMYARIGKIAR